MFLVMTQQTLLAVLFFFSITISSVFAGYYDYCTDPLVHRGKLTATSQLTGRRAQDGFLESGTAWAPENSDFSESLTVDLGDIKNITQIATRGRSHSQEFVREFTISFGFNGLDYALYKENDGSAKLFRGNSDGDSIAYNEFETPIIAQFVRINPTRWSDRIAMRVEVYGCDYFSETVAFNGTSIIYKNLTLNRIQSRRDSIRFRFRTSDADGILFYSHGTQGDYLALQIVRNKLVLNMNLGSAIMTSVTAGSLLDDGIWHDVSLERRLNKIAFTIDRVELQTKVKGDFQILDLDRILYIGGSPNIEDGLIITKNFTGCMENFYLNHTNVINELKNPSEYEWDRFYSNFTLFQCSESNIVPFTFLNPKSFVKLNGYEGISSMNVSLEFRCYEEYGTIIFHKFTSPGYVKLYLERGMLLIDLEVENSPKLTLENFAQEFNDGEWHQVELTVSYNSVTLKVDERLVKTRRLMQIITGELYWIGGIDMGYLQFNSLTHLANIGFVGCVRLVSIDGNLRNPLDWKPVENYCCNDSVVVDSCQMLDRCTPNPCEHGGICKQTSLEFDCECEDTGYSGAVCHTPLYPTSCQAFRNLNPTNQRTDVMIDPDGSGPLEPFMVTCLYYQGGPTETWVRHENEESTNVDGFPEPGGFVQDIHYDGSMLQIEAVINRSEICKQYIEYKCKMSRLFSTPYRDEEIFRPFTWWVSRYNQPMDYWGDSLPGSRKCECGLLNNCIMENVWCNCDAALETEQMDSGYIIDKEFLPVRQLRIGDTGTLFDEKMGRYLLGPLICEGDILYENVVTFRLPDAALTFPTPVLLYSWDIYFEFKTTTENAVFLHIRGPNDFIKVSIANGDLIQFQIFQSSQVESGSVSVKTSNRLNDNEWHTVLLEQNRKQARIVIDGALHSYLTQPQGQIRPLELTSDLFVGSTVDLREGYVGCMHALTVNGEVYELREAVEREEYGVGIGCTGKCDSNPCLNNGTCLERYNKYLCDCRYTAFKGPICADEIGVNLQSNSMIRYDFIGSYRSTIAEKLRVGFTTTEPKGFLVGLTSNITGEYLTLMISNSGHLRLVFDFGFERQEVVFTHQNFATGEYHDVQVMRMDQGTKLILKVDDFEPQVFYFDVKNSADAQFNNIQYLYIGKNETMREGFIGCISRVEFDDLYPLKYYYQDPRPKHVHSEPPHIVEDFCSVEPVTHPPEIVETRPLPDVDEDKVRKSYRTTESAILAGMLALIFLAIVIMAILIGRYLSQHKGEYITQEDEGAADAADSNDAAVHGVTGHQVQVKKEWFI